MQLLNLSQRPQVLSLIAGWHFNEWRGLYPQQTLADFSADLAEGLHGAAVPSTWLLMQGEEVLGTASLVQQDLSVCPEYTPWLANVFIHPQRRGEGLGQRLIQGVLERAQAAGLQTLYLFTEDQVAFYQRLGFQPLKTVLCHQTPVTVMYTELPPPLSDGGN